MIGKNGRTPTHNKGAQPGKLRHLKNAMVYAKIVMRPTVKRNFYDAGNYNSKLR